MTDRTDAFISYSHADQQWLQRIKVHLRPLERDHEVLIWQDTNLRGGQRWRQEIDTALAKAKVAILLISPDFLASDFIHNDELPPLLDAAAQEGLTILSVIVSACAFKSSPLQEFQAINPPDTPLDSLPASEVNKQLVKLFERVKELFANSPAATLRSASHKAPQQSAKTPKPAVSQPVVAAAAPAAPLALLVNAAGQWNTVSVTFSQIGNGQMQLTMQANTPAQRAFIASLDQGNALSSIVYNEQTYVCRLRELNSFTEGGKAESWKLNAEPKEPPQSTGINFNGISPIEQAQIKARLLLLNERPVKDTTRSPFSHLLSVSDDYTTPLFALYHTLRRDADRFLQTAPLVAAWYLHMNGIVTNIFKLTFALNATRLQVDFEGQRQAQYQNEPDSIEVTGDCEIPDYLPAEALPLRLVK